jgi:hypothetical protein
MMKMIVTNNGETSVSLPMSSLIPDAAPPALELAPGDSGEIIYRVPPTNDAARELVATWADAHGHVLAVDFHPYEPPAVAPEAAPVQLPSDPLGLSGA